MNLGTWDRSFLKYSPLLNARFTFITCFAKSCGSCFILVFSYVEAFNLFGNIFFCQQLKKEGRRNEYEMHKLLALNQRQKMVNNHP